MDQNPSIILKLSTKLLTEKTIGKGGFIYRRKINKFVGKLFFKFRW